MTISANKRVLSLDISGRPLEWIDYEEAAYYYTKDLVAWTYGDPVVSLRGGINKFGNRSTLDIHPVISHKGKMWTRPYKPPLSNMALFRRDEFMCMYCGETYASPILTRDHIIPKSRGGPDTWMNVVCACKVCNMKKADRTPEEAGMPLLAVPFVPNYAEYLFILRFRNILGCQMDILRSHFHNERLKKIA